MVRQICIEPNGHVITKNGAPVICHLKSDVGCHVDCAWYYVDDSVEIEDVPLQAFCGRKLIGDLAKREG